MQKELLRARAQPIFRPLLCADDDRETGRDSGCRRVHHRALHSVGGALSRVRYAAMGAGAAFVVTGRRGTLATTARHAALCLLPAGTRRRIARQPGSARNFRDVDNARACNQTRHRRVRRLVYNATVRDCRSRPAPLAAAAVILASWLPAGTRQPGPAPPGNRNHNLKAQFRSSRAQ